MKKLLFLFILMLTSMLASANDGDTFSEETVEGVLLNYTIISESEKTCMVGYKKYPDVPTARNRRGPEENVSQVSGDITIPEEAKGYRVVQIETSAFEQTAITGVFIPNSVKTIGSYAFQMCVDLKSVRLSEQLTRIAGYTFYGCKSLTSIDIPEGVTSIGDYAFAGCEQLKDINIPSGVEQFGKNVFWNTGFTSLPKLPESLTVIPKGMFYECTQLTSIEIPENITMIDECAFGRCPISEIEIPASVTHVGVAAFANCKNITDLTIPDNVTEIGFNAFNGCSNLKTVKLSNNITSLNQGVFNECSSLESVIIPNGVKSIGKFAFEGCSSLGSINLPETLEEIGEQAFFGCSSLKQLFIPKNFVRFGKDENNTYWSFIYGCTSLTSIVVDKDNHVFDSRDNCNAIIETASNTLVAGCITTKIPEGITVIGSWAFGGFHDLTSITLPHSLNRIEQSAFNGSGLREITLPENVTYIGAYAFSSCNSLKDFYCCAEKVLEAESSAFGNTNLKEVTLHVPAASVSAYQATKPWKNFKEIVALAAQDDYHPLIEEGKHWTYDNYMPLRPSEYDHYYYYDLRGDTLIAGQQCLKMYSENLMNNSEIKYQGSLFEENKKVYYFSPGKEKAELLYDFDCFVGDTLHVRAGDLVVKDIQTEDNGGIAIKRYTLYETNDMLDISWIEGVGASTDFFGMMPYPGNYNTLNACELNGEKLYQTIKKDPTEEGYHKMGIEGKRWNYIHYYIDNDGEHFDPYWYVVKGDTIIRRTNYKILYYQDEKTERPVCLLREVGREVFKCDFGDNSYDTPLGTSFFHFGRDDFGRVFSWKAKMEAGNTNWMVYNVDTIKVNNRFFRRYTCLQKYSEEGQALTTIEDGDGVWHDIWVEGIGSASSGIEDQNPNHEPPVRTTSDYTYFVSCYENGECIFTADDFNVQTYTKPDVNIAYRPFIEEGKVWKVGTGTTIVDNSVQVVDYYYFDGDTIIGGKTCKQMMCQRYVSPNYSNEYWTPRPSLTKVGAWYEEDKKVYSFDERQQTMTLKYDFSLEANDTLHFLNVDDYPPFIIGPKQTGGIEGFKGVYRDIMMCRDEGQNIRNTTWLEGVGGLDAPFRNAYDPRADLAPEFLMSCTVGDEIIYLNDRYEDGATPESMGARKNRFDFTHTIKTKPKARKRSEEEPLLYGEYNDLKLGINLNPLDDAYQVRITDDSGKIVYEKAINAGNIVGLNIDISAYAKGRYTITVENSDESFTGEFNAQGTGIEVIKANKEDVRNNIYNLQGQRLSTLQKGLNIVNGQKIYVK